MRRAQSLRSHAVRASVPSISSDDLGVLREEDSVEDTLRKQLLAKDRENDKLQAQILALQDQLRQRPPLEHIQELEREYKNLELLLTGTQRENERCMAELERAKSREKMLEREIAKLAGENWQSSLSIPSSTTFTAGVMGAAGPSGNRSTFFRPGDASSFFLPQAESTLAVPGGTGGAGAEPSFDGSGMSFLHNSNASGGPEGSPTTPKNSDSAKHPQNLSAALAHIAQVRTLILGMEERMQTRETRLTQEVARAEAEACRFEAIRKEVEGVS